ncbi:MAG: lytic transglycosylase domain-containing protein [Pyrinomonadaceae bacterium]|nr:lytic transglycosylase domain-containing protein [Pyrinomonadaceae bacterium]MCX7639707.1 lytic transglycosylase domain-containing protein [Pyrinomonadaceae bacterium]MDW8304609.1 lytic transglycosylase domain-containing protein [Acidobacteriota bacterium]
MKKISLTAIATITLTGAIWFNHYWIHRYDKIIRKQSEIYRLDEKLVWSIIYEETYFRQWKVGSAGEIGLMQITPAVAREWAKETGIREIEKEVENNTKEFLSDPERNIQIGCWYLEKLRNRYRGFPAETAMTIAAYNAGASRVKEWLKDSDPEILSEAEFIERINIPSTKSYVTSILKRYYEATNR